MSDQAGREITFAESAPICMERANKWIERNMPEDLSAEPNDTFTTIAMLRNCIHRGMTESPRDWTPCAEGMPTEDGEYWVTFMHYGAPFVDKRTFHARTGIWAKTTNVIAWMPKPAPYNPDHIVDANKKVQEDANDGN